MTVSTLDVQRALKARSFDPGPLDGILGRKTIEALKEFQKHASIAVSGTPDTTTLTLLFPTKTVPPLKPIWYLEAERLKGIREGAGRAANNATIIAWAKGLGGWVRNFYTSDATPWCGLFVGHVIATTLPSEPLPNNPLGALEWKKFGRPLARPTTGAILVFKRLGGGHVGFYAGEDDDSYTVLGGNQSNMVNLTTIAKSRHVDTRWPGGVPLPTTGAVRMTGGKRSTNEA